MNREAARAASLYFRGMYRYRIQGIPESIAGAARATMRSPQYGHPAHVEVATGYGPCRLCLQTFAVGTDERLLFTYQPFTDSDALPLRGRYSSIASRAGGTMRWFCPTRCALSHSW
jgi:hypothetical protein